MNPTSSSSFSVAPSSCPTGTFSGQNSLGARPLLLSIQRRPTLWACSLILLSLTVRLWFVLSGQLDLVQDEAQYWDWSRRFQLSYYSKGPLVAWVIDFWASILGPTEAGVRMGAVVNATLAQILMYIGVAKLLRRPALGVLTLLVANTMPLFLASGVLITTDNILLLCWLGALLCLYALCAPPAHGGKPALPPSADVNRERKSSLPYLVTLGLCMALGNLSKYMMLAMFVVAALYFCLLKRQKMLPQGAAWRAFTAMTAGALLGYLPILIWNAQHGWIGFLHVGALAGVTGAGATRLIRLDTVPEFLGAQFGVASPWWMTLMLFAGWRAARFAWRPGDQSRQNVTDQFATTGNADQPALLSYEEAKPGLTQNERVRQAALLACAFWPIWGGMFLWSFHTRIYANWPGMSYVGGIILAAAGLERLLAGYGKPLAKRLALVWPVAGALLFALIFAQNYLPLPAHLNPASRLKGWADLGHELGRLASTLPNPQKVFYFGDNYDVTAELAFYAPGQPIAYSADFGRRRSQYDLWPDPMGKSIMDESRPDTAKTDDSMGETRLGWDAFYVSTRGRTPDELHEMFDEVTTIPYVSTHRGKPGREFTIVLLRNFNGHWPRTDYAQY